MRRVLLGLLALSATPERARAAEPPAPRPTAGLGAVVHVTAARAYLDAGAEHGLAPGQVLRLLRGGVAVAGCELETVAPRHATCRPDGAARRGDHFRIVVPAAAEAPRPLPPLVAAEELDRRAAALAAAPHPKVEAKASAAPPVELAVRRGEVGVSHAVWSSSGFRAWQQERLDAAVRGAPAFAGLTLDLELQAVRWSARPATARGRPRGETQLHVWEAALSSRDPSRAWTGAAGRVLPWTIPGATTFDGLQLALASPGRTGEVGVFGGLVPDPVTLAPAADRSTAGLYGSLDLAGRALSSRSQARAAVTTSPELGTRVEVELRAFLLVARTVNVEGVARAGVGGRHEAAGGLDLAQVDVSGRPHPRVVLSGLFRYAGLDVPDAPAPALFPGRERRWDATAGYELGPALLSASGGLGRDLGTGLERWHAGPELAFPRLFGARGGVSLGYAEERGWIAGRTAWAQAALRAGQRVRLSGRLTWTQDARPRIADDHALGLLAGASADLGRWLSLHGSVLARLGAMADASGTSFEASGITARAGLACRF